MVEQASSPASGRRRRSLHVVPRHGDHAADPGAAEQARHSVARLIDELHDAVGFFDRQVALQDLTRRVRAVAGVECGFAAPVEDDGLVVIRHAQGLLGDSLVGLSIAPGRGLGGLALAQGRPVRVIDYGRDGSITHDFDRPVLAEGLQGCFAVPLVFAGTVHGVVWGAMHQPAEFGDRVVREVVQVGNATALRLHLADQAESQSRIAIQAERRRVASDLHDSLGATLFNIGAMVRSMRETCPGGTATDPPVDLSRRLSALEGQISEASSMLRTSLSALYQMDSSRDLAVIVKSDVDAFRDLTSVPARLVVLTEIPPLEAAATETLVSVCREGLLNIRKHADASVVVVTLARVDDGIMLTVRDDGVGIDEDTCSSADGLGLASHTDRVGRLGGRLTTTCEEDGTTLRAWLPTA